MKRLNAQICGFDMFSNQVFNDCIIGEYLISSTCSGFVQQNVLDIFLKAKIEN